MQEEGKVCAKTLRQEGIIRKTNVWDWWGFLCVSVERLRHTCLLNPHRVHALDTCIAVSILQRRSPKKWNVLFNEQESEAKAAEL